MPLLSLLFQGNPQLEACLAENASHVTPGAQGEHVAKIQYALFVLDRLIINRMELVSQTYGPSTAAAVLAYKTKRQIINRSYQASADDIVGKMTIAALDTDMRRRQSLFPGIGDCALTPPGEPLRVVQPLPGAPKMPSVDFSGLSSDAKARVGGGAVKPLNRALRIFLAITRTAALSDGFPQLSAQLERAKDSLFPHGLTLSVEFNNRFADVINYPGTAGKVALEDDIVGLRKASEDMRPGLPDILRVIVCPMNDFVFGETFRNRSIGNLSFPPFVLLSSRVKDQSNATLLHEMIHAASKDPKLVHDSDRSSIFFEHGTTRLGETDRTVLKPEHAAILASGYFKL